MVEPLERYKNVEERLTWTNLEKRLPKEKTNLYRFAQSVAHEFQKKGSRLKSRGVEKPGTQSYSFFKVASDLLRELQKGESGDRYHQPLNGLTQEDVDYLHPRIYRLAAVAFPDNTELEVRKKFYEWLKKRK